MFGLLWTRHMEALKIHLLQPKRQTLGPIGNLILPSFHLVYVPMCPDGPPM